MVDWSGPQTSRNRSHGTVKHSVNLLGVGATAPDWCAVLCSRVDQCQGGDFQGLGSGSPCGSRKAADQGDTCSGLRTEVFQVLAKRQRAVQFHTQVSWCRLEKSQLIKTQVNCHQLDLPLSPNTLILT